MTNNKRERERKEKKKKRIMQPISGSRGRIDRPASNEWWQSGEFRSRVDVNLTLRSKIVRSYRKYVILDARVES